MRNHRRIASAVVAASFLSATAAFAATVCVNPANALCQATIQLGVNAAAPGDIVKIAAGTYFEAVMVPAGKDGLQLVGASKLTTILDPSPYADLGFAGGDGITVLARRVTIKNLMIRNGHLSGILVTAPEILIQGVNVNGTNLEAILVRGGAWNARIVQNEIHNATTGIDSAGFGTVAQGNLITGTRFGIMLAGDGGQAIANKVYNGYSGISASADGAVVKNNDVRYQLEAIFVNGTFPTVQGNRVYGAHSGIEVACTDCFGGSVAGNSVTDATSFGILASADDFGLVLQKNTLLRTGLGLSINGIGITARLNKVTDVGLDIFSHCIEAFIGDPASTIDWNTIVQNTVTGCSQAGIYVHGSHTLVERNVVSGTFENGITVDESNQVMVSGNKATGNAAQGIAVVNGSDDTEVSGNTATGNRRDFCDDGTGTSVSGNTFGTSFTTPGVDCTIAALTVPATTSRGGIACSARLRCAC